MKAEVLQFKVAKVWIIAYCESCEKATRAVIRKTEHDRYLNGVKKICPDCGRPTLEFVKLHEELYDIR